MRQKQNKKRQQRSRDRDSPQIDPKRLKQKCNITTKRHDTTTKSQINHKETKSHRKSKQSLLATRRPERDTT